MPLKSKNFQRETAGRLGNESFGQASSNVGDALSTAVALLKQQGLEFSSYDAVAICQMIMDENYRLEAKDEEFN